MRHRVVTTLGRRVVRRSVVVLHRLSGAESLGPPLVANNASRDTPVFYTAVSLWGSLRSMGGG